MLKKLTSRLITMAVCMTVLGHLSTAAEASTYDFLTVTGNGIGQGNNAMSQFMSPNGLGVIKVTHSFSPIAYGLGPAPDDNNNPLLFPSDFTGLFPGSGQVQGHLAQTQYGKTVGKVATNSTSTVTFDLTGYTTSNTVFGIWNTTTEVAQPAYRLEAVVNNVLGPPTGFQYKGNTQNLNSGVTGIKKLDMNLATGDLTATTPAQPGPGPQFVHSDAAFWEIPQGTQKIIVHGNLGVIDTNFAGDGVGYYFAELCPSEGNLADLIANHGMICNGDKKFSDFAYHPIGDMPDASQIDVVSHTDAQGNLGIRFIGPFADQPGGGASERCWNTRFR